MSALRALALIVALVAPSDDRTYASRLDDGLRAFYLRDFATAQTQFAAALARVPDDAFAAAFVAVAAAHRPGALDALLAADEARAGARDYGAQVRLGFARLVAGRDDAARDAFAAALAIDPARAGAHDGMGVLREHARRPALAKQEFTAALAADPHDVVAREELALIYQVDLKDPLRAFGYAVDVTNLVPGYADIDFHLASLLDDLHAPDAAITYATRGLALDVGHVGEAGQHGYTLLARIYLERKRPADARRVLRAAIDANVDVAYATALLRRIDAGAAK